MKITVLSEMKALEGLTPEHGLSFLVQADGQQILFDTGATDVFLRTAEEIGINLENVPTVVLSHGHFDHGDGLQYLGRKKLVCHPGCFVKRYRKHGSRDLGLAFDRREVEKRFTLVLSTEPYHLTEHLIFMGEIPRKNDFEARETPYRLATGMDDFIMDDSGLVCITGKGLVVVSGCAHSGICNMVDYAVELTGISKVNAVIGGFHLKQMDEKTRRTIEFLREKKVNRVLPSHCTMDPALEGFYQAFGRNEVKAGEDYQF